MILPFKFAFVLFSVLFISSFSSAQLMSEYTQKTGRLTSLESKIKAQKEALKGSLKAIYHSKDKQSQKNLFTDTVATHEELKKDIKEYNAIRLEIKYKFPQKNDQTNRRYLPLREVSLEEIENELGIDGILNRVKSKIDKKYKSFTLADKKEEVDKKRKKSKNQKAERLRLER